ncbi:amidase family protein [Agrobacterium vitis]|uniref:amidase family protein n=1 Tax=Agrobacterium vitis TaxID=373 RepID=UPI0018D22898|nr:amidase family protein [Agrobacterium vitis]
MTEQSLAPSWAMQDGFERTTALQSAIGREAHRAIFTALFPPAAPTTGPLNGCVVSVKALFDVAGHVTHAGSARRLSNPPAVEDAAAVSTLRGAGASLIGHTNMTELAYSGLGLNPHFGTPETPVVAGAIAGGSSSGAAASVARGYADIGLASDTGGSARIPAAFCGLVGWKPTASRIDRRGTVPLSFTLDGVGLIGRSVTDVAAAFSVLSPSSGGRVVRPTLLVPEGFGLDELDPQVAASFETGLRRLRNAGWTIGSFDRAPMTAYANLAIWQFAAVESRALHPNDWKEAHRLDPHVRRRMQRADEVAAAEYAATLAARQQFVGSMVAALSGDILLLPTVAILPPLIEDCSEAEAFDTLNRVTLRNTSLANVMDGCSISLPVAGHPGTGLMLTAGHGQDDMLLAAAREIEAILTHQDE